MSLCVVEVLFFWYSFHVIHVPTTVARPTGTPIPMAILSDVLKPLDDTCAAVVGEGVADGLVLALILAVAPGRCTWFIVTSGCSP